MTTADDRMKRNLTNLKYTPRQIKKKRRKIYRQILAESKNNNQGNFNAIGPDDLARLFDLYDTHFFDGFFNKNYNGKIFFRLSDRMTRAGGKIEHRDAIGTHTIVLSTALIFQTFSDVTRQVTVNGVVCRDRLEATMSILEHEIIHLLEQVHFGSTSCSSPRFKRLSRDIFGHTDVTHRLVTQIERAHAKYDLRVGSNVSFEYAGVTHHGVITRITVRATVMVKDPDGDYRDLSGAMYSKYYIPLEHLRQSDNER